MKKQLVLYLLVLCAVLLEAAALYAFFRKRQSAVPPDAVVYSIADER